MFKQLSFDTLAYYLSAYSLLSVIDDILLFFNLIQIFLKIGKIRVESMNANAGTIAFSQGIGIFIAQR